MSVFCYNYHFFDEDDENLPIITLEVMQEEVMQDGTISDKVLEGPYYKDVSQQTTEETDTKDLTDVQQLIPKTEDVTEHEVPKHDDDSLRIRNDLLEYTVASNGSVTCKLCEKPFASRSHWYRHKYRAHQLNNVAPTPAPLFQCEQCLIFFKSRKGYIGHIASKHSETLQDASPVLTNAQAEALAKEMDCQVPTASVPEVKKEPDPEMSIPKTVVPNYQAAATRPNTTKNTDPSKRSQRYREPQLSGRDWEERRSREDKLVADIIARVRRECEAQGPGPARRGYSRKSAMRT